MKKLFLLTILTLSLFSSHSQDCALISTETDDVTGESFTGLKKKILLYPESKEKLISIDLFLSGDYIVMNNKAIGSGKCIDSDAKMYLVFRDGSRANVTNSSKFNCQNRFTAFFGSLLNKDEMDQIYLKQIKTIRIMTSKGYVQMDLTEDQSRELNEAFKCLLNALADS